MDQESNDFNVNSFNKKTDNEILNNKPLNNQSLKIISPFLIYCVLLLLFSFDNLFKITDYKEFFEIVGKAVFAGFFEELIFRHWLQESIGKKLESKSKKSVYAVFVVGILFGILHMTNLIGDETKTAIEVFLQSLSAIGGGLLLGAIYYKTKKYLLVSSLHSFYNIVILLSSTYCVVCSANETLELILQVIFNSLIAIYLLKDVLFFCGSINADKKKTKFKIIYYIVYILLLVSMILLWRK